MEDFEIVDLMGILEGIGHETQDAFKVVGTRVPDDQRIAYTVIPEGIYSYSTDKDEDRGYASYTDGDSNYHYTGCRTEEYHFSVGFTSLFVEEFGPVIKSMGDSYFFLDTSKPGEPSFSIWGNSSGIIKLKKEVKLKFPEAEILEIPYHETKK